MHHYRFTCTKCWKNYVPNALNLRCEDCQGTLSVQYKFPTEQMSSFNYGEGISMPIPIPSHSDLVSLGEGNTPVLKLSKISNQLDLEIYAKLEFMNPTGSFKDRGTSMMISALRSMGVSEIVEDSSGNAGASVAAYSSKAEIKAHIFAPSSAPDTKLNQIKVYGSVLHSIDGSRDKTTEAAEAFAKEKKAIYASHNLSPFFIEGTKSFGYEIFNDFGKEIPENIIVPVGNGSLFLGIWKAITELDTQNLIGTKPSLHCIQAVNVNPIASPVPWNISQIAPTIAGGIAVGTPPRKSEVRKVLEESNGFANSVTEESIKEWQINLAKYEGIFCEPTSAAAFAGLENLVNRNRIDKAKRVLIPVTGSGLKDAFPE